jgi:uncharacterized protein YyaL (SSP411 family)
MVLGSLCFWVFAQKTKTLPVKKELVSLINNRLEKAAAQYRYFTTQASDTLFPKTISKDGTLESSKSWWWCSGFYPGTLLYLNENKSDDTLYKKAMHYLGLLEKEQYNKGTHDLGFMMYCSFGNAQRLWPDKKYQDILVQSAKSLASRYSPVTGCIRSWNSKNSSDFLVIIDNMMNLELLFYAAKVTSDSSFYRIAVSHADKTIENHFRPDYSSFHVVNYNSQTGAVKLRRTQQGAADASAWARGQAWGLYGYTLMYRETRQRKYLDFANRIAEFILNHPHLPKDKVPYWDFDAPGISDALRDASAAAVMASAFTELATYADENNARKYLDASEDMLTALSNPPYQNAYKENRGFLLKHSVGSLPQNSEVDVPLTYADYYYVEAMMRYKKLAFGKTIF